MNTTRRQFHALFGFLHHPRALCFPVLCLFFAMYMQTGLAQERAANQVQENSEGQNGAGESDPAIAEEMQTLQARFADLEKQLAETLQLEAAAREGLAEVGVEVLQGRVSALRKLQGAFQRRVGALRAYENALKRKARAEEDRRSFQHLVEPPPYTMAFLDQLSDRVDLKLMDIEAEMTSLQTLKDLVIKERSDIPTAKAIVNRWSERLRQAGEEEQKTVQFEHETAKLLVEANEAELLAAEMELKRTETHIAIHELELETARRRVALARTQTLFSQEELDEILEKQEVVTAALVKEEEQTRKDLERVREKFSIAEQKGEGDAQGDGRSRESRELDLLRMQVEAVEAKLVIVEALLAYEQDAILLWELRFTVANPASVKERPDWAAVTNQLRDRLEVLRRERAAGEQRTMSLSGQIMALEGSLREVSGQSNAKRIIQDQLNVLSESILMRNRLQQRLGQMITLVERVLDEAHMRQTERPLAERISDIGARTLGMAAMAFDRELTEIGGESITGRKLFYMVLILIGGLLFSRLVTRYIQNYALQKLKLRSNAVLIIAKMTNYILFLVVVYLALNYVNIPLTIFTFLGGAIALGIGFGAQNLINNFLSGLILMGEQPIRMGDIVEIENKLGVITNIGARASQLRMFNGFDLLIPNSKFLETNLINWTLSDSKIRLQVEVGVAYDSSPRDVARLMMHAVTEHGLVLEDPEPKVLFESFGDNALNFSVYFWVELGPTTDSRVVMSDVRYRIHKLFKEAEIVIAYPQRDIHIDTNEPLTLRLLQEEPPAQDS